MAHFNFGQGSWKEERFVQFPSHSKGEKAAVSSELCLLSEFISGFLSDSEICPGDHSILVKCFTVFTRCHSSAWHAWGLHCCNCSPRAALPAAVVCSTAFTTLRQETNCFHYCPTCHPIGLISSFSIPRYSQFHTYLFAICGPDSYYSSTWTHCLGPRYTSVIPYGTIWEVSHLIFSMFVLQ